MFLVEGLFLPVAELVFKEIGVTDIVLFFFGCPVGACHCIIVKIAIVEAVTAKG